MPPRRTRPPPPVASQRLMPPLYPMPPLVVTRHQPPAPPVAARHAMSPPVVEQPGPESGPESRRPVSGDPPVPPGWPTRGRRAGARLLRSAPSRPVDRPAETPAGHRPRGGARCRAACAAGCRPEAPRHAATRPAGQRSPSDPVRSIARSRGPPRFRAPAPAGTTRGTNARPRCWTGPRVRAMPVRPRKQPRDTTTLRGRRHPATARCRAPPPPIPPPPRPERSVG